MADTRYFDPMQPQPEEPALEIEQETEPREEEQAIAADVETAQQPDEMALAEDFEEELIIEDFTIDGICGVY